MAGSLLLLDLDIRRFDQFAPFARIGLHRCKHLRRRAADSRSMIGCGVFAGASSPNQPAISKPGTPDSLTVGTSGIDGTRCSEATASSRSLPPSDMDLADGGPVNIRSTTPATTSVIAGAVPRYET